MKIKVLFFVSTLESGGPTNVIFNIIKYIDRDLIEPVIVTLSPEPLRSSWKDFENLKIHIYQFNQSRASWLLSNGSDLKQYIAKIHPHVIHSHSLRPDIFSARHLETYVRISTIHANLKDNYRNTYSRIVGDYFAYMQIKYVARLEKVVACAKSVYEVYKNKIDSIGFIPNGVDSEIFKPIDQETTQKQRLRLGLPLGKNIFITVGSLCKRKDPETVIKGFLRSNCKDSAVLLVLGTGKLEPELRATYSSSNIIFKGFIKDVAHYLKVADFFISASRSEGLPNTVLEALSCGLPICLSDIPAHNEILSINTNAGITFPCGEDKELSNAINTLAKKDYDTLQKAAISIIEKELSARKMSANYQKLYLSLTNNTRHNNFE
jgi:glycosyltransferase involved in cell wall biosynthesis